MGLLFTKQEHTHEHYHVSEEAARQQRMAAEAEERTALAKERAALAERSIARRQNRADFISTVISSSRNIDEKRMKHEEKLMLLEKDPEAYKMFVKRENRNKIIKVIAIIVILLIFIVLPFILEEFL